ncbi:MAG: hypothetical protein HC860_19705 [Alkalinema sp. RU_4_3]|nr:hypothetical protein [Alkalinema sp. RU_4_3]
MSSPTLTHPKLQVSVQQFFKGLSWSGQVAPTGITEDDAIIQTFHPTEAAGDSLSLMRSVRGFMSNIPWTGTGTTTQIAVSQPAASAPTDLDAFSDFF